MISLGLGIDIPRGVAIPKGSATSAPGAPTDLTLGATTYSSQALSWTAPANNGGSAITGYKVYYAEHDGTFSLFDTVVGTSATVTGLDLGTNYDYLVAAVNALGNSATSNMVTERTLYLEDSFTGAAANAHNTTADSGQTRTTVTGRVDLDGSGNLIWADDGSATSPSEMKYEVLTGYTQIKLVSPNSSDGLPVTLYFNANASLTEGWKVTLNDVVSVDKIEGGANVIGSSYSVPTELIVSLTDGNFTVSVNDGEVVIGPISFDNHTSSQIIGLCLTSDGGLVDSVEVSS